MLTKKHFFTKRKEFIEHMTEVLDKPEKIDIKTFDSNYRIVINKLDKFKKGTGRRGSCFSERDDEIKNIRKVLEKIKESSTTVGGRKSKKRKTYKRKTYQRKTYQRKTYKRKTYKRKKNRT
jgi:phosphomevalonate kinase